MDAPASGLWRARTPGPVGSAYTIAGEPPVTTEPKSNAVPSKSAKPVSPDVAGRRSSEETNQPASSSVSQSMGDKLLERILSSALPTASVGTADMTQRLEYQKGRPPFSIPATSKNYRMMTARMGIIFEVYYAVIALFTWKRPSETLSMLSIYSFACLHPRILVVLPFLAVALGIMVPAYVARHPPSGSTGTTEFSVPDDGPALCEANIPKPVPDFSREFYLNVVDTQNSMAEYVEAYDLISGFLSSFAFFANESISSSAFIGLLLLSGIAYIITPWALWLLPWKAIFLAAGWIALAATYPDGRIKTERHIQLDKLDNIAHNVEEASQSVLERFKLYAENEFVIVPPHEQREVEVFEIQRFDAESNIWTSSFFYGSPYGHLHSCCEKSPEACPSSLQEIIPPSDWAFITDTWVRDYTPQAWVDLHLLTNLVLVDDKEKWVYDAKDKLKVNTWRRRRWVRACSRRSVASPAV